MSRPVNRMRPVHPGEVLREDFLIPIEKSVNALAMALAGPATRIHEIIKVRRGVTANWKCPTMPCSSLSSACKLDPIA